MLKTSAEAAQLLLANYQLDDPDSDLMRIAARTPDGMLKPWRANQRYQQSYRPGWTDVRDLICQLHLEPGLRAPLAERLAGPEIDLADLSAGRAGASQWGPASLSCSPGCGTPACGSSLSM